jgi:hypothetical protein
MPVEEAQWFTRYVQESESVQLAVRLQIELGGSAATLYTDNDDLETFLAANVVFLFCPLDVACLF